MASPLFKSVHGLFISRRTGFFANLLGDKGTKRPLQRLARIERAPRSTEFAEGVADPREISGGEVGRWDATTAASGGECFRERGVVGGAAPLGGFEAFDECGGLEQVGLF